MITHFRHVLLKSCTVENDDFFFLQKIKQLVQHETNLHYTVKSNYLGHLQHSVRHPVLNIILTKGKIHKHIQA